MPHARAATAGTPTSTNPPVVVPVTRTIVPLGSTARMRWSAYQLIQSVWSGVIARPYGF
jgi:hypothetical protein